MIPPDEFTPSTTTLAAFTASTSTKASSIPRQYEYPCKHFSVISPKLSTSENQTLRLQQ
jgi:hypothetical protein